MSSESATSVVAAPAVVGFEPTGRLSPALVRRAAEGEELVVVSNASFGDLVCAANWSLRDETIPVLSRVAEESRGSSAVAVAADVLPVPI